MCHLCHQPAALDACGTWVQSDRAGQAGLLGPQTMRIRGIRQGKKHGGPWHSRAGADAPAWGGWHEAHPADLSSTRALHWQHRPGGTSTALPWPSTAPAQLTGSISPGTRSSCLLPSPPHSFLSGLWQHSQPWHQLQLLTLSPALLVLLGWGSRAGDTKAQHRLCTSIPFLLL